VAVGNILHSPLFLTASSAENLHKEMLKNNAKWNSEFVYFDLQFVKGKWYAWYYFDHKLLKNKETR